MNEIKQLSSWLAIQDQKVNLEDQGNSCILKIVSEDYGFKLIKSLKILKINSVHTTHIFYLVYLFESSTPVAISSLNPSRFQVSFM